MSELTMKCGSCGISPMKRMLFRINQKDVKGEFWCLPCIETKNPKALAELRKLAGFDKIEREVRKYEDKNDKP